MDNTEQIMDDTEQIMDDTEQIMDDTEQIMDDTEQIMDDTGKIMDNTTQLIYTFNKIKEKTTSYCTELQILLSQYKIISDLSFIIMEYEERTLDNHIFNLISFIVKRSFNNNNSLLFMKELLKSQLLNNLVLNNLDQETNMHIIMFFNNKYGSDNKIYYLYRLLNETADFNNLNILNIENLQIF
jgi:hypothetical protein